MSSDWPPVASEPQRWEWTDRPRSRADRLFRDFAACVPPNISQLGVRLDGPTSAAVEAAAAAVVALDRSPTPDLSSLAGALLRSESVGSSKIEHLDTDARSLAVAAIGGTRSNSVAAQVWANVRAMEEALRLGGDDTEFGADTLLSIHRVLMQDDPAESAWAGRLRTMQNWIGGSDECPRDALFVPPAPGRVPALLDDLAVFCRRTDLPALVQAAIAHAQFETIHPFTDGNGRTGRALIHTVIRRRRLTSRVVVPTSAALLTRVDAYFDALGSYRDGDLLSYLDHFLAATTRAAQEAGTLGSQLADIAGEWQASAKPRAGSVMSRLLESLLRQPVMSAQHHGAGEVDTSGFYRAVDRLVELGIITEITDYGRNRMWVAPDVTAALDDFNRRIGRRQDGRR